MPAELKSSSTQFLVTEKITETAIAPGELIKQVLNHLSNTIISLYLDSHLKALMHKEHL